MASQPQWVLKMTYELLNCGKNSAEINEAIRLEKMRLDRLSKAYFAVHGK
jgi:hypothetical protein